MTDIDRGAYAPQTDGPLTFDARGPRRSGGGGPAPFTLIFSAVVLLALAGAVFMFYRGGVRQAGEAPPMLGQPVTAMREAAPVETTPADPAEQLDVYIDGTEVAEATAIDAPPAFAPPPEQPRPRPAPRPTPAPTPAPVQVAAAPPANPAPLRPAVSATPDKPRLAPVAATVQTAQATPLPPKPNPVAPAAAAAAAAAAAPTAMASAATGGGWGVQIGAFTSPAIADEQYAQVVGANPSQASGKSKLVQPVQRGGATLYRTIVSGFSREAAAAFCAQLKAQGRDCLVKGAA